MAKTIQELEFELKALTDAKVDNNIITAKATELAQAKVAATNQTPVQQPASAVAPASTTGSTHYHATVTDPKRFDEGGEYVLNVKDVMLKSKVVAMKEVDNKGKKSFWFTLESDDPQAPKPNRGIVVGDLGKGSGMLRGFFDGLKIPYMWDSTTGALDFDFPALPLACWALWTESEKAIGHVGISNVKSIDAVVKTAA
jgi:hypothetical protein